MGKIFLIMNSFLSPGGVPIDELNRILCCIPGNTYLTFMSKNLVGHWSIECENCHFADGTEIQGIYQRLMINGNAVEVFKGVDIINPPTIQTASAFPSGGVIYYNPNITPMSNNITYTVKGLLSSKTFASHPANTCTCGADKVGGFHSNYCDKKDLND